MCTHAFDTRKCVCAYHVKTLDINSIACICMYIYMHAFMHLLLIYTRIYINIISFALLYLPDWF